MRPKEGLPSSERVDTTTRRISKYLFWRLQGQRSGFKCVKLFPSALLAAGRMESRTLRDSPHPQPHFVSVCVGSPDFLHSHCSWRSHHHPQHRSYWSSQSCPTKQVGSMWQSPQPAARPAAGCQEELLWLHETREKVLQGQRDS